MYYIRHSFIQLSFVWVSQSYFMCGEPTRGNVMQEQLKLMCILAHPDDESMGTGGILSKYAAEGVATYLVCATRGERGWDTDAEDFPGLEALGKIREAELLRAAGVLGLQQVDFLDFIDGELDQVDPAQAVARIAYSRAQDQAAGGGNIPARWRLWAPRPHRHLAVYGCGAGVRRRLQLQSHQRLCPSSCIQALLYCGFKEDKRLIRQFFRRAGNGNRRGETPARSLGRLGDYHAGGRDRLLADCVAGGQVPHNAGKGNRRSAG